MRHVEGDDKVGLAIDRGFQNHFVSWIGEFWPPRKIRDNSYTGCAECIQNCIDVVTCGTRCSSMLWSLEYRLVLKHQWH